MVRPTKAVSVDQEHIERIDEELLVRREQVAVADDARGERARGEERAEAERGVDLGRMAARTEGPERDAPREGRAEQQRELDHRDSPFSDSR